VDNERVANRPLRDPHTQYRKVLIDPALDESMMITVVDIDIIAA
jgi:hypothetical protein